MMRKVLKLNPEQWKTYSENAHRIAFGTIKPATWDRIDFALLVATPEKALGYVTCREFDHETLYWQFGGSFPGTKGSSVTYRAYQDLVDFCKASYKRITTLIENTNIVMLKMAMKIGFRIVGIRNFKGSVLLEHLLEFGGSDASV